MQKLVYAIFMTKRKLRTTLYAYPITVVSKYPLGEVIQDPEAEGRIAKWALELMGQNITYAPRSAIKSQILADFVAEWTVSVRNVVPTLTSNKRQGLSLNGRC
jgi:hypothetical protein